MNLPSPYVLLSMYNLEFDLEKGGSVYYRETYDNHTLQQASIDTGKYLNTNRYIALVAYVITFENVPLHTNISLRHTFQVIITFDKYNNVFAVLNFMRLDSNGALTGHALGLCKTRYFESAHNSSKLVDTSNIDVRGRHVYLLSSKSCWKRPGNFFIYLAIYILRGFQRIPVYHRYENLPRTPILRIFVAL